MPAPQSTPDSQLEALIVLGSPAVVLGFGRKLAFLVTEMGPNDVDFNEWTENARSLPLEVIGSHHYWRKRKGRILSGSLRMGLWFSKPVLKTTFPSMLLKLSMAM